MNRALNQGFTLTELMIVVAIIGILAAIAYPSYLDSTRKARRADAKGVLLQAAQWMERFYTENNCYHRSPPCSTTTVTVTLPITQSPIEGTSKYYDISLSTNCTGAATVTANAFTLSACPIAGSAQANDKCGTLTLTHTGAKGISGASSGVTPDECWR